MKVQIMANKIIISVALCIVFVGVTGFYVSYSQESGSQESNGSSVAPAAISDTVSQILQDETVPRSLSVAPTEPVVASDTTNTGKGMVTATQTAAIQAPDAQAATPTALSGMAQVATPSAMQIATPVILSPAALPSTPVERPVAGPTAGAVGAANTVITPDMEVAEIAAQALPSDILMPSVGVVTEPVNSHGVAKPVNGHASKTMLPAQAVTISSPEIPAQEIPAEIALPTALSMAPEQAQKLQERQGPTLEQVVTQAAQETPAPVSVDAPAVLGSTGSAAQYTIEPYMELEERVYSVEEPEVAPGVVDITPESSVPAIESDEVIFDEKAKRQAAEQLVKRGIDYFNTHSMAQACHAFTHTKEFWRGELYLFLISYDGTAFAHGQQKDLLWKNIYELRDSFGTPIVQAIINSAKRGGGWVTYSWRNATKISYVQEVKKDGKLYAIGTGYYPHSKVDAVVTMVKGAVGFFNQMMRSGKRVEDAFSPLSYPIGRFVYGDLYLYALDFKGTNLAHGARPGLIGTNSWNYKDAQGRLVNQEIIQQLKMTDKGVWIEYLSGGAHKRAYAEKVTDMQGNNYFIACGYYTDAGRKEVVDLVRKGYQFMKTHGISAASEEFSDVRRSDYRHGDLYLVVYDMSGKIIAHGANPEFIGRNHYDDKDEAGRHYVREFIQKGRDGGGWVDIKMKNSFQSVYVEKVDLGIDSFIVACGVYPVSKYETMELLAKSGLDYLEMGVPKDVFAEFVDKDGKFIRGDLSLFVFDTDGICYAYGDDNSLIWHNLLNVTDDKGVAFVQQFINTVKQGSNMVRYTLNGVEKIGYISSVQKDGKVFVVGSSYYR